MYRQLPLPAAPRLVCVGRLSEQKGQLLLLEAARILAAQSVAFEIVLAGDGELREEIEALIAQHGLEAQVRITGWISSAQVREEILAARALVLPSFAEGLPVVIMEAMALRRPVLTTYVAGIPELVLQGENGWLFPAGAARTWRQRSQTASRNLSKCCSAWARPLISECWSGTILIPKRPNWRNCLRIEHDHVFQLAVQCTAATHPVAGAGAVYPGVAGLPDRAIACVETRIAAASGGVGACTQ